MTTRYSSPSIVCALALALVVAPTFRARAQTATDTSSTAPATPAAAPAVAPAPAAPADTNAAPATTTTERPATYTIAKGDSLWTIAHKYGTTVVKLRKLNNLKKGAILQPGQVLQMPPATSDTTTK